MDIKEKIRKVDTTYQPITLDTLKLELCKATLANASPEHLEQLRLTIKMLEDMHEQKAKRKDDFNLKNWSLNREIAFLLNTSWRMGLMLIVYVLILATINGFTGICDRSKSGVCRNVITPVTEYLITGK